MIKTTTTESPKFVSRLSCSSAALVMLYLGMPSALQAQAPQPQPFQAKGQIVSIRYGEIVIVTEQGKRASIKVKHPQEKGVPIQGGKVNIMNAEPQTKVHGVVSPSALRKGQFVRLKAIVSKKNTIEEPIKELTIFNARKGFQPVVSDESAAGDAAPVPSFISAPILEYKRGNLTLFINNSRKGKLRAKVSPDAVVTIQSNDYSWGRPGDMVVISGNSYGTDLVGTKIDITKSVRVATKGRKGRGKKKPRNDDPFKIEADKGEKLKPPVETKPGQSDPESDDPNQDAQEESDKKENVASDDGPGLRKKRTKPGRVIKLK